MKPRKVYCFFEQSGTFKNEFKKLGYPAEDYDILNDYGQTDHVCDLFNEIRGGYEGKPSIFDEITSDDLIMAFFPCTRFECQIRMSFLGLQFQMKNWSEEKKLEYAMKLHGELHELYTLISQLAVICLRKNIPVVIENPYAQPHYLTDMWCLKPKIIDNDRTENGDYYKKPTQYWFLNCEPTYNIIFEPIEYVEQRVITKTKKSNGNKSVKVMRSEIHPQYASRFIRQYILDE